jgi:murein DD-endopeptidase MepM/ murein hydrolase activator NlpD
VGARSLAIDQASDDIAMAASTAAQQANVERQLPDEVSRDRLAPAHKKAPKKPTPKKIKPTKPPAPPPNPWTCAVTGCVGPMVSGFGARVSPGGIGSTYHLGDDFAVAWGTSLHAMHYGTVVSTGWVDGFGIHVTVDYGDGIQIIYGHMSRVLVVPGQRVARGQVVGYSGDTGISTGPHLHLEIHVNGTAVNPTPWLRARGVY